MTADEAHAEARQQVAFLLEERRRVGVGRPVHCRKCGAPPGDWAWSPERCPECDVILTVWHVIETTRAATPTAAGAAA